MAVRWEQRFLNFTKALNKLTEAITYARDQSQYSNDFLKKELYKDSNIRMN